MRSGKGPSKIKPMKGGLFGKESKVDNSVQAKLMKDFLAKKSDVKDQAKAELVGQRAAD